MKPMGRKHFHGKKCKHYVRIDGEYNAWWLDVCTPSKKAERQSVKREIREALFND